MSASESKSRNWRELKETFDAVADSPHFNFVAVPKEDWRAISAALSEQQPLNPVRALLGKRTPNFEAAEALGLPTPRLQFRWELLKRGKDEIEGSDWLCHYELVIRLGKNDIRNPREYKQESEKAMPLGGTKVNTTVEPLRNGTVQTPFRDSGHMKWDAEQLGIKHCYAIYGDIVTPLGQSNERTKP